jgi:hypothetical protein
VAARRTAAGSRRRCPAGDAGACLDGQRRRRHTAAHLAAAADDEHERVHKGSDVRVGQASQPVRERHAEAKCHARGAAEFLDGGLVSDEFDNLDGLDDHDPGKHRDRDDADDGHASADSDYELGILDGRLRLGNHLGERCNRRCVAGPVLSQFAVVDDLLRGAARRRQLERRGA